MCYIQIYIKILLYAQINTVKKIQLSPFHSVVWQSNIMFLCSFMNNEFVVYGTKPWYWIHTKIVLLNTGFVNITIPNCNSILLPLFAVKLENNSGTDEWTWYCEPSFHFIPYWECSLTNVSIPCSCPLGRYCWMDRSLHFSPSLFQNVKHAFQKVLPVSLTLFKRPVCHFMLY